MLSFPVCLRYRCPLYLLLTRRFSPSLSLSLDAGRKRENGPLRSLVEKHLHFFSNFFFYFYPFSSSARQNEGEWREGGVIERVKRGSREREKERS